MKLIGCRARALPALFLGPRASFPCRRAPCTSQKRARCLSWCGHAARACVLCSPTSQSLASFEARLGLNTSVLFLEQAKAFAAMHAAASGSSSSGRDTRVLRRLRKRNAQPARCASTRRTYSGDFGCLILPIQMENAELENPQICKLSIRLGRARVSQKAPESVAAPHVGRFEYSGMLSRYYKAC